MQLLIHLLAQRLLNLLKTFQKSEIHLLVGFLFIFRKICHEVQTCFFYGDNYLLK